MTRPRPSVPSPSALAVPPGAVAPPGPDVFAIVGPFQKQLAAHGVEAHPWAIVDGCEGDLSPASLARFAQRHALEAQLLELKPGDLEFVRDGTLVALDAGGLAIVVARDPRAVTLEYPDGTHHRFNSASSPRSMLAIDIRPKSRGEGLLRRLVAGLRDEPHGTRAALTVTLLGLGLVGLGFLLPLLTQVAIGRALPSRAPNMLALAAAGTALVGLQQAYLGWLRRRAILYLTIKLAQRATFDLMAHMLRLPFSRLRSLKVSAVQQIVGSASAAAEAVPSVAPQIVDGVLALAYLGYTFYLDPLSAAVAGGAGLFMLLVGIVNGKQRLDLRRELHAKGRAEQQTLYETLAGIETVKSESAEGRMLARWLDALLAEQRIALRLRLQASTVTTLLTGLNSVVLGATLLLIAQRCLSGDASSAILIVAVQTSSSFMRSMQGLAQTPAQLTTIRSDLERADEMLKTPVEGRTAPRRVGNKATPAIVLRDVWFRYDEESPWVLSGVNLVIGAGETVILSWPSGSGKSTLLRLLAGLLSASRGDVLVFGTEAAQARRMVTYVPQTAGLFPGSVIENLRLLSGGAKDQRILATAEATGLATIIASWPMGFDTVLSVGSSTLSSGQRQLLLFTAAAASEAPIVLLDEALAHVDLALRARLGTTSFFAGRTVVTVAHDATDREASGARLVPLAELSAGQSFGGLHLAR